MALYRKNLGRGIFFNHIQTDVFKTSSFSVNFVIPHRRETAALYSVLPMVLHRGCRPFPDRRAISLKLESLYGTALSVRTYKRGELRVINFTFNTVDNAYLPKDEEIDLFGEALSLLSSILLDPVLENGIFLNSYVTSEIRNCKDAVRAAINNKARYAFDRCTELMFRDENYGIPGDGYLEDYDAIQPAHLLTAYRKMLQEARVEIFYGGKEVPQKIEPFARALFANIPRNENGTPLPLPSLRPASEEVQNFEESTPAEQGKLVLGFRSALGGNVDFSVPFFVFNEIFGGSASSKLFMNVREKKSLCYSCSSTGDFYKGALFASAGIANENKDITVQEIQKQLDNIRQKDITDEELHCAKQSLISGYQSLADSISGLESWYLRRILSGYMEEPEEVVSRIQSVTKDEIAEIANSYALDTVYFLKGDKSALYNTAEREEEEDAE